MQLFIFFPYEEYEIIDDKLHYKKKLKIIGKSFVMEKFDVSLKDIEKYFILSSKKLLPRNKIS